MKSRDPSFISKKERMREEKQMTKEYGGED